MAFETFTAQHSAAGSGRRRRVIGISVGVHALLITVGVIGSYWHVDELAPPVVIPRPVWVELPKPQAGPKGGGGKRQTEVAVKEKRNVLRQPSDVTQPAPVDEPAISTNIAGQGGVGGEGGEGGEGGAGGVGGRGGEGGCLVDCGKDPVPPTVDKPVNVSNEVARGRLTFGPYPHLPPVLVRLGSSHFALTRICADVSGTVTMVKILESSDPMIDPNVIETLSTWRYAPYAVNGHAVPFCTVTRFAFETR